MGILLFTAPSTLVCQWQVQVPQAHALQLLMQQVVVLLLLMIHGVQLAMHT
jgi:hypothetical protein